MFAILLIVLSVQCARTLIVSDLVTIPATAAGILLSVLVPPLHGGNGWLDGLTASLIGASVGLLGGYVLLRVGKTLFGKERLSLSEPESVVFDRGGLALADCHVPYEELFYRDSDEIVVKATSVHIETTEGTMEDVECNVEVRLSPKQLVVGSRVFEPDRVAKIEATADSLILPREALGLGVAKVMSVLGAFTGWKGVLFASATGLLGGFVAGVVLVLAKRTSWPKRMDAVTPLNVSALVWVLVGPKLLLAGGMAVVLAALTSLVMASLVEPKDRD